MNNHIDNFRLDTSGNSNWKAVLICLAASTTVAMNDIKIPPSPNTLGVISSKSSIDSTTQNHIIYTIDISSLNTENIVSKKLSEFIKIASNVNHSRNELFKLYDFLYNIIKTNDVASYKIILDTLDVSSISIGLIVGLLRTSFLYRYKIDNWAMFLEKSKKEILNRDPSKHKLLSGLM